MLLLEGLPRYYQDVGKELDCSDIIDELYPEPGDPIVEKFGYGAFHNTNLDDLLKARHVESVLVTGTVTQICVEETARESFKRGYRDDPDLRRRVDLHARPAGRRLQELRAQVRLGLDRQRSHRRAGIAQPPLIAPP